VHFLGNLSIRGARACRTTRAALFTASFLLFLACVAQAGDTGALIAERCRECHGMDTTCAVETDDPQWWNATVGRMVEYKVGLLGADEARTVSLFLTDGAKRASLCPSN